MYSKLLPIAGAILENLIIVFGERSTRADEFKIRMNEIEAEMKKHQITMEMKAMSYQHEIRLKEIEQAILELSNKKEKLILDKERIELEKERLKFEWEKWSQGNTHEDKETYKKAREAYEYHERKADEKRSDIEKNIVAIEDEVSTLAITAANIVDDNMSKLIVNKDGSIS